MNFLPGDLVKFSNQELGRITCPILDLNNYIIEREKGGYIKAKAENMKHIYSPCSVCNRRAGKIRGKCFICGS